MSQADLHRSKIHDFRTPFVHSWANGVQQAGSGSPVTDQAPKHWVLRIYNIKTEHIFPQKTELATHLLTAASQKAITPVREILGRNWSMLSGRSSSVSRLSVSGSYDAVPVECPTDQTTFTSHHTHEIPRQWSDQQNLPPSTLEISKSLSSVCLCEILNFTYTREERYEQN